MCHFVPPSQNFFPCVFSICSQLALPTQVCNSAQGSHNMHSCSVIHAHAVQNFLFMYFVSHANTWRWYQVHEHEKQFTHVATCTLIDIQINIHTFWNIYTCCSLSRGKEIRFYSAPNLVSTQVDSTVCMFLFLLHTLFIPHASLGCIKHSFITEEAVACFRTRCAYIHAYSCSPAQTLNNRCTFVFLELKITAHWKIFHECTRLCNKHMLASMYAYVLYKVEVC
jgi:hypothetical protein